jgi:hypothetical protein
MMVSARTKAQDTHNRASFFNNGRVSECSIVGGATQQYLQEFNSGSFIFQYRGISFSPTRWKWRTHSRVHSDALNDREMEVILSLEQQSPPYVSSANDFLLFYLCSRSSCLIWSIAAIAFGESPRATRSLSRIHNEN